MKIVNLGEPNSIINQYLTETRDVDYQRNRLLFRSDIQRTDGLKTYEISKQLDYEAKGAVIPLGISQVNVSADRITLITISRTDLPFHNGLLNIFDHVDNAFASVYREYTDEEHRNTGAHVEHLATPSIDGKTLIIADPMLAAGASMELGYKTFLTKGTPRRIHIAYAIVSPEDIEHIQKTFPEEKTTIQCAAISPGLNEHQCIVPGPGDASDLCYGEKL